MSSRSKSYRYIPSDIVLLVSLHHQSWPYDHFVISSGAATSSKFVITVSVFWTYRWLQMLLKCCFWYFQRAAFFPPFEAKFRFFCLTDLETCGEKQKNIYKILFKNVYTYTNKPFLTNTLFSKVHETTFYLFFSFLFYVFRSLSLCRRLNFCCKYSV